MTITSLVVRIGGVLVALCIIGSLFPHKASAGPAWEKVSVPCHVVSAVITNNGIEIITCSNGQVWIKR